MTISFKLTGQEQVKRFLARVAKKAPDAAGQGLVIIAEEIMATSKRVFVPVRKGILRSSGHVQPVVRRGKDISVDLVYGGAASAYAVVQHENMSYVHKIGEAKYLSKPLNQAVPGIPRKLAAHVAQFGYR